jgi:hypothetical protein
MAARGKSKAAKADPVEIVAIKGFDSDFACAPIGGKRVQYKIGETFEAKGKIVACHNGLHSVECPFDVFNYYPASTSRYALVRASGEIARHDGDSKIASAKLYVEAELKLPDIIRRGVEWLIAHAKTTVATGDSGHAAATGDRGHAAATGDSGHAAATGYSGHAAATGDSGHAAATGDRGHAAATGDSGHAAATGYSGHAAATGDRGHAAATGDSGHAAATGEHAIAASLGPSGTAKAGKGGWIVLAHWNTDSWPHTLTRVERFKVGSNGVEAGKTYRLTADGKPEEVR